MPFVSWGQCPSSVSISADTGQTICENTTVTFTANAPGGTNLNYQWQVNGSDTGSNNSQFTTNTLTNGAKVKVIVTLDDDASCSKTSNTITMTVNPNRTGSVSITANNTNICPGETVNFSISNITNAGSSASYDWRINNISQGSGTGFSSSTLQNGDQVQLFVQSSVPCTPDFSSNIISITEKPGTPSQPGAISGIADVCPGTSQTYTISSVANATEYIWSLPSGWTGSSTTTSITVNTGSSGSGNISVAAKNSCGTSTTSTLAVVVKDGTPAKPGAISGQAQVCPGSLSGTVTYSVSDDPTATSYNWTLPTGWTMDSNNGSSISVIPGNAGQNGTISVTAENDCGISTAQSLSVSVKPGTPATPTPVSGATEVCPTTTETYQVSPVANATEYIWTLPSGWTGSSTSNTITVTTGSTGTANISVAAKNDCDTGAAYTWAVTVKDGTPSSAGTITQSISGGGPVICEGETVTYSVSGPAEATSYNWTVPNGWTITSGAGTDQITVTAGNYGQDGSIKVKPVDDCGIGPESSLSVSIAAPAPVTPGAIDGTTEVCKGSSQTYTVAAVPNATEYVWSLPGDWTGSSTTNSITVTTGSSGNISVAAKNSCGESTPSSLGISTISGVPNQPGTITGLDTNGNVVANICPPASGLTFEISPVAGADSYEWDLPTGWQITGGDGTEKITVNVPSNVQYGNNLFVKVAAVNVCGTGAFSTYYPDPTNTTQGITIGNYVVVNAGADKTVCRVNSPVTISGNVDFNGSKLKITPKTSGTGTFNGNPTGKVDNFSFTYTPSQNDLNNLDEIIITITTEAPTGACGPGEDKMSIFLRNNPAASISGDATICEGDSSPISFIGSANTIVTYKINGGSNQTINLGASGQATLDSGALNSTTTYSLVSAVYSDSPACTGTLSGSVTITVTPTPTAQISYADGCSSETDLTVNLTGTGAYTGGNFSADPALNIDANTGSINPSLSTPGTYTVTYTIPASGGCEEIDVTTQVNIIEKVMITTQASDTRACEGGDASFEISATGDGLSYQWYKSSVSAGNEVSGGTSAILNLTNLSPSDAGDYLVVVSGTASCSSVTSNPVTLTVDEDILITNQPESQVICENGSVVFTMDATSGGTPLDSNFSYQWYKGTPGSGSVVSGGTSASLTIDPVSLADAGDYYVEITGPSGYVCNSETSSAASLEVRPTPTVQISGDAEICSGTSTDLYFSNGIPNGIVTYTINNDNNNPQTFSLDATGEGTLNTGNLTATSNTDTNFIYTIKSVAYPDDPSCSSDVSGSVTVTVAPNPEVSISFPDNQTEFCNLSSSTESFTPVLTGTGTYSGGTFSAPGLNIDPNTGTFTPGNENPGDYTISYTIPAYGGCAEEVTTLDISIYDEVKITSQPYNLGICSTQNAEFSVTATGDDLSYQWYKDGTAISGATSNVLSLPVATSEDAGEYFVRVAGTNACTPTEESMVESDHVTLNVDEDIVIVEPAEDVSVCETGDETVSFRFVVHAKGAPLSFEWIYADGTPVSIDNSRVTSEVNAVSNYEDYTFDVYIGTLTIRNVTESDEGSYAVRIDGSDNNFTCPEATSNSFNLEVNPVPTAPVVTGVEYCTGETAVALTAGGDNLKWYDVNMNPLSGAPTPVTDTPAEFTYYVTQTPLYCESEPAEITVSVYARPAKPIVDEPVIDYCLGEIAVALTATADADASLNWYDSASSTTPLSAAPVPPTTAAGILEYWVSQTNSKTCEGEREKITVNIHNLPNMVPPDDITICEGDTVTLEVSDSNDTDNSTSFVWTGTNGENLSGSSIDVSPTETTTYTITATNEAECTNTEEVTVNVDAKPVGGTLDGSTELCVTQNTGTLTLTGQEGTIARWEYLDSSVPDWTPIANTADSTTYDYTLQETTKYRAVLTNGICDEVYSTEATVIIDPKAVGGELNFMDGSTDLGRVFLICEDPTAGYAQPLVLTGQSGASITWQYRTASATSWTDLSTTNTSLSANEIESIISSLGNIESLVFRVRVESGVCPVVYSKTAIISVIPSDIKPGPVTASPEVVCYGDQVTLSSETGYGNNFGQFDGGDFDNSSIANYGWRIRRDGSTTNLNFDSSADNIRPDLWLRTVPHDFITAELNSPYTTSLQWWDSSVSTDGNKGFAIVSGNHPSTMETPVFSLTGMDEAILTFDQAYNLTTGASIAVELSTDGGGTYTTLYTRTGPLSSGNYADFGDGDSDSRPENKLAIDLGDYMGYTNLRIRFHFMGVRDGDVWALDNITVPDGPQGIAMEWRDYTDSINFPNGEYIGSNATEQWTPKQIGWNIFQVKTKIIFDTNGNSCTSAENFEEISIYVFDNYTSTATAISGDCGDDKIQLNGVITGAVQGEISDFPEDDESTVAWEVVSGPSGYTFSEDHFTNSDPSTPAINNPQAIFTPGVPGEYTIRWKITQDPDSPCETTYEDLTFDILNCTKLDFDGVDDYVVIDDPYTNTQGVEAWIRPESENGPGAGKVATILAGDGYELYLNASAKPVFKWNGKTLTSSKALALDDRWYHLAVSFNSSSATLYIDGIEIKDASVGSGSGEGTGSIFPFLIGAGYDETTGQPDNFFSGWIEEVRIWNTAITQDEIRFMMNQRLINNGSQMGELIPMDVPGGLTYSDLAGYYRLISSNPDPAGLVTFDASLMPSNGLTPDLAQTSEPGRMHNMQTNQQNTAPLPYISAVDGQTWATDNTWIRPNVWDPPNSNGVNGDPIDWNIARISHNIDSGAKDITLLGLLSDTSRKLLRMAAPGTLNEYNDGQMLRITHYLLLNGNIDLVGESQLVQDQGSLLAEASVGWLERDQQGTKSSFNYNYWSAPVSKQGTANNSDYNIASVLLDGTNSNNPIGINFQYPYAAADGALTSPITLSEYWMWRFRGTADVYAEWIWIGAYGTLRTGEGYTMKGTDGSAAISDRQNYIFKGKPHNGDFTRNIGMDQNYLLGNPYPSALDANEFLLDNLRDVIGGRNSSNIFNGVVYFWDHFSGHTHILREYVGGYAAYTLAGGVPAISNDERIDANLDEGTKIPKRFIPVGQGFFVNTGVDEDNNPGISVDGGDVVFRNYQRAYSREIDGSSIFMKPEDHIKSPVTETRSKIRLKFHSPTGYHRQLLVTLDENTTDGFDLGYDAPLIEDNAEDMYWLLDSTKLVIQAVPDFNEKRVLPLGIKVRTEDYFKIQIDTLENFPSDKPIYLRDKLNDSIHNLREGPYDGTSVAGQIHNRFEIIFYKEDNSTTPEPEPGPESLTQNVDVQYNHNTRELKILNPDLVPISKIMIFDLTGRMIQDIKEVPLEEETIIQVNRFRSSVYIVKIINNKGKIDQKFIMK